MNSRIKTIIVLKTNKEDSTGYLYLLRLGVFFVSLLTTRVREVLGMK